MVLRPLSMKERNELYRVLMKCDLVNPPDCLVYNFFRIEEVDGKGFGWKANEDISPGTLIHLEKSLLSINKVPAGPWMRTPWRLLMQEIQRLTLAQLQEFQELKHHHPGAQNTEEAHQARFVANNFQMSDYDASRRSDQGIFIKAARLNHSCLPNVWVNWNRDLQRTELAGSPGCLTVYAIRPIKRDEEIVMDYQSSNYLQPRENRRASLEQTYHFKCRCPACEEGDRSDLSESRRAKMRAYLTHIQINNSGDNCSRESQREAIENMIQSLKTEGLFYPHSATFYGKLADWGITSVDGSRAESLHSQAPRHVAPRAWKPLLSA